MVQHRPLIDMGAHHDEPLPPTKVCSTITGKDDMNGLCSKIKEILGDKVGEVVFATHGSAMPCVLTTPELPPDLNGGVDALAQFAASGTCLEVDRAHQIVVALEKMLSTSSSGKRASDLIWLLYETAAMMSGRAIEQPTDFVRRICDVIVAGIGDCSQAREETPDQGRATETCNIDLDTAGPQPAIAVPLAEAGRLLARADDPRSERQKQQRLGHIKKTSANLNTNVDDHDPASTLVRPAMRVLVGGDTERYEQPLTSDDVLLVRNFACREDDFSLYYRIIEDLQNAQASGAKDCKWASWKDGCHLISKAPEHSPAYCQLLKRILTYFQIVESTAYIRFNWYVDGADWKPLHHDTAAFSQRRSGKQNITVGVSLGGEREVVFRHTKHDNRTYMPQPNGTAYSFGNSVNINWKHGINALPPEKQQSHVGRISIIIWGWSSIGVAEPEEVGAAIAAPEAFMKPCLQFQRGKCTYGDRCKFMHVVEETSTGAETPVSQIRPDGEKIGSACEASQPTLREDIS